jgi:small-conductance mechanosensitive channel
MLPSPCRTRSTIVQTFDNVTVIIPNSDFISKQVTNWSLEVLIIFRMGPVVIDPDSGRF